MTTETLARRIRAKCIEIASLPVGCHIGGALSCVDLLAVLYGRLLREEPRTEVILSKGHAAAALYATLWKTGRLTTDPAASYGMTGSPLTGHPNTAVPGVSLATGSLGHGPSLGLGIALGKLLRGNAGEVVVIVGDGELQEGAAGKRFNSPVLVGSPTTRSSLMRTEGRTTVSSKTFPASPTSARGSRALVWRPTRSTAILTPRSGKP